MINKILLIIFLALNLGVSAKNIETQKEIAKHIRDLDIPFPEIVMKQAILESGYFTSKAHVKRNNFLGMFEGKKQYSNPKDCLIDYKKFISKKYKDGDYYSFLKRLGYCECDDYVVKLKEITLNEDIVNILKRKKYLWENYDFTYFFDTFVLSKRNNYKLWILN